MALSERDTTPLLGRDVELAELIDRVGLGPGPRPTSVVLGGDAGVGKTRLLKELGQRARLEGWRVLVGHCLDFGDSALPLLPFTEILGRLDDIRELVAPVLQHHPAISRLLPAGRVLTASHSASTGADDDHLAGLSYPPHSDPTGGRGDALDKLEAGSRDGAVRSELFEGIHAVLERIGEDCPVLVVVEDLHWADRSTRDLLSFLFTRRFTAPVVVVASYRHDDLHRRHPLRTTLAEWGRMPSVSRMHLAPLRDDDVRRLVRSVHPRPDDADMVEEIVRRAEGNAFFAEELMVARELSSESLPTDLADLLLVRLDRLPDQARAVVRAAACVGRRVPHALLAQVVDLTASELDDALRAAVEANVLIARADGRYTFRHALLAEAVYDDLLPGERARIHLACAQAMSDGRVAGTAAELARHSRAGHDYVTAVVASVEAGEEALAVGGPDEAAAHLLAALDLLSVRTVAEQVELARESVVLLASDALVAAGHAPRALQLLLDEVARLEGLSRGDMLVTLVRVSLTVDDPRVRPIEYAEEALELLGEEPSRSRARALVAHAVANSQGGRFEEAARSAQAAYDLATTLGLDRLQADAATTLGRLKSFTGDHEAARTALEQVVVRLRASQDSAELMRALHQLGGIHFDEGQLEAARRCYREAFLIAQEQGRPWAPYGFEARLLDGIAAYMLGDWAAVDAAADTTGSTPPPMQAALLYTLGLQTMVGRGDPDADTALESAPQGTYEDGWSAILATSAAIDLRGDAGDLVGTVAAYDQLVELLLSLWQVTSFPAQVRLGALVVARLADAAADAAGPARRRLVERGEALMRDADAVQQRGVEVGRVDGPEAAAWVARLHAEMQHLRWLAGVESPDLPDLIAGWEASVEAFDQLGHPYERARSQLRLAVVLAQAGSDHANRVGALIEAARATASELGALPLLARLASVDGGAAPSVVSGARAALAGARVAPAVTLTPREQEVIALVAAGRTNGEIARQLFITTKTVSVHVSNILAKVGASSRTEASAIARTRGLLDP